MLSSIIMLKRKLKVVNILGVNLFFNFSLLILLVLFRAIKSENSTLTFSILLTSYDKGQAGHIAPFGKN